METTPGTTPAIGCRSDCRQPAVVEHRLASVSGRMRAVTRCVDHAALEPATLATLHLMGLAYLEVVQLEVAS